MKAYVLSNPCLRLILSVLAIASLLSVVNGPLGLLFGQTGDLPPEVLHYADMIVYNGKVLTADDDFTVAEALAVRDGKFLAVGDSSRIQRMAGPNTRQIDLQGKTVIPGIIDTHFHLDRYIGLNQVGPSLKWETEEAGIEELKALAAQTPPGEWVVVRISRTDIYNVTRQELDQASTRHPIALISSLGDEYAVNSEGLKRFPPGLSGLQKDPDTGEYTGQVRGFASGVLDYELIPWPNIAEQLPHYRKAMLDYAKAGMTTTVHRARGMVFSAYRELWLRDQLTMRVRLGHEIARLNPNLEAMFKRVGNLTGFGDDWLKIIGVSPVPPDGAGSLVWTSQRQLRRLADAPSVSPYGQDLWGMMGEDLEKDTEFRSVVLAGKYGWSVNTLHSAGDAANDQALLAYEKALEASKELGMTISIPYGLDHGSMITPEQIKKMKELGVIPSLYVANSIGRDPSRAIYLYGADAVNRFTPTRSLIEAGVRPAGESDTDRWPYITALWNIEKYVTRTDEKGRVWGQNEAITREQGLLMFTNWAAYYTGDEKILGTIEPQKLADFVVLDGDFMGVAAEDISEIPVVMTVVGAKIVFDAERDR